MEKFDTMTGTGSAMVSTPANAHRAPTNMPMYVLGAMSPYPTVVMVTIAHHNPSGMLLKSFCGLACRRGWKRGLVLYALYES